MGARRFISHWGGGLLIEVGGHFFEPEDAPWDKLPVGYIGRYRIGRDLKKIERHPEEYRYSYDEYFWFNRDDITATANGYSDRMGSWFGQRWWDLCGKHETYGWYDFNVANTEAALAELTGKRCEVVQAVHSCNVSTGYPLWWFSWKAWEHAETSALILSGDDGAHRYLWRNDLDIVWC